MKIDITSMRAAFMLQAIKDGAPPHEARKLVKEFIETAESVHQVLDASLHARNPTPTDRDVLQLLWEVVVAMLTEKTLKAEAPEEAVRRIRQALHQVKP